jgi:glycosyltransferase involved in cell wall biosynthesis
VQKAGVGVTSVDRGEVVPRPDRDGQLLRIAMVVPPYFEVPPEAYGGVEAMAGDLTDALVRRGHSVTVVGAGRDQTTANFVQVWPLPVGDRLGEATVEVAYAARARRAVQLLATAADLDLVHDHTLAGPLNASAYSDLGLPTVVTAHGSVVGDLHEFYAALASDVDLVAISQRQRALAPELNWVGTIHNGVRVDTFPFRQSKEDYVLFLGRFHPDKAPHLALAAAHAAGYPLVLAGKCAEPLEKAYFDREVRPLLGDRDVVYGMADATAKRRLLTDARCLLFPVQGEEPFGLVMIEAMACGTPVVALRHGAVPEVVDDGVTGFVCDGPAELATALGWIGRIDPAACRQRVVDHFDVDLMAQRYEATYRATLAARAAANWATRRSRQ